MEHVRSGRLAGRDRVGAVDAYNIGDWLIVLISYRLVIESRKATRDLLICPLLKKLQNLEDIGANAFRKSPLLRR